MPFGIDFVRSFLNKRFKSVYEKVRSDDHVAFMVPFSGYNLMVRVHNERDFISFTIQGRLFVGGEHQRAVLAKAMELNYKLILGRYGCDPEDGELTFEVLQATDEFQGPWEAYEPWLERMLNVAMLSAGRDMISLKHLDLTGNWPTEEKGAEEPDLSAMYEGICPGILKGETSPDELPSSLLPKILDLIIKISLEPGRDKLEDYPDQWQRLLRERMGGSGGTEI